MPVYEYQCKKCGHVFDREHAVGEQKTYRCPECSSQNTQKIISQVGIIFKGSGFYATDHRKSNGSSSTAKTTTSKPAYKKRESSESTKSTESTGSSTDSDTSPASEN